MITARVYCTEHLALSCFCSPCVIYADAAAAATVAITAQFVRIHILNIICEMHKRSFALVFHLVRIMRRLPF